MKRLLSPLILVAVIAGFQASAETAQKAPESSGTNLVISLERSLIRENDDIPIEIWIRNASDYDFSNVKLHIAAPTFLRWHEGSPSAKELPEPISINNNRPIPARSAINQKLVLTTGSDIIDGDYTILFTLEAQSTAEGRQRVELATAEKSIQVHLLGTESIGGVPLALAALILPGLFFWLTLGFFQVPKTFEMPLGDKLIYSVIISVVCLTIAGVFRYFIHNPWLNYFALSASLSIPKLFALVLAGSIPGAITGLCLLIGRARQRAKEKKKLISPGDNAAELIYKILLLNPRYTGIPVAIRLKDSSEFVGAHWARTVDATFLVGSFEMRQEDLSENLKKKIEGHSKDGEIVQEGSNILQVVEAVRAVKPAEPALIRQSSPVAQVKDGARIETGKNYFKWANDEISGVTGEFARGKLPLLILT